MSKSCTVCTDVQTATPVAETVSHASAISDIDKYDKLPACLRLASVFFFCNKTDVHKGKLENDVTLLSLVSENDDDYDDDDDYAYFNECIRNFLASPCSAQNKRDADSFN
jgi:hypothetical protein